MVTQLDRKSDRSGRIVAFRRSQCPQEKIVVKLRGLDQSAVYELEDQDTMDCVEKTGAELAAGFELVLKDAGSSLCFKYRAK